MKFLLLLLLAILMLHTAAFSATPGQHVDPGKLAAELAALGFKGCVADTGLTQLEFEGGLKAKLIAADENGDTFLTAKEFLAYVRGYSDEVKSLAASIQPGPCISGKILTQLDKNMEGQVSLKYLERMVLEYAVSSRCVQADPTIPLCQIILP
mmetsp:Transcript_37589/g.87894  ORF Transcript_37589/g.87894 Transcript_37589/m.87894 type:complete len:153 (-) Transcript_37589:304-762(-)